MDQKILDLYAGIAGFIILVLLLVVLPFVLPSGVAYLAALAVFIISFSWLGIRINRTTPATRR